MPKYSIIGSYPRYAITRDGCELNQYLCNTEGEAKQLIVELQARDAEYKQSYWPEAYISDDPNWPEKDPDYDL